MVTIRALATFASTDLGNVVAGSERQVTHELAEHLKAQGLVDVLGGAANAKKKPRSSGKTAAGGVKS